MTTSFKKWLNLQEISVGSDGVRDNAEVRTAQASEKIASKALNNPSNSEEIASITSSKVNKSLRDNIMDIAARSTKKSGTIGKQTNGVKVASSIATSVLGPQKSKKLFPAGVN